MPLLGPRSPVSGRPARRAVRDPQGRRRDRRWWTILLLAADSLLGALLLRSQGRAVWRALQRDAARGQGAPPRGHRRRARDLRRRVPDHARASSRTSSGVLLLLPPTRALVRRIVVRRLGRRVTVACAGARAGATTTSRARAREYDDAPSAGSSGERPGARAVLLRRRPRHPRDGAVGRDDPVRGPQADAPSRRGPRSRPTDGGWRAELADTLSLEFEPVVAGGRPRRRAARTWPACAARPPARAWTASAPSRRPRCRRAWEELDAIRSISALVDEQHALWRSPGARAAPSGHGDEEVVARPGRGRRGARGGGRPHLDRLRRRRPPAQRRARAVAARRGLPAPRLGPGDRRLVARPRRRSRCTPRSSAGGSTAARASAPTS